MVTSPSEWKILEWDDKHQTNKQTKQTYLNLVLSTVFFRLLTYLCLVLTAGNLPVTGVRHLFCPSVDLPVTGVEH